ncbi:protease complex subunit PrcB family protein [Flavobacteriaceae bacterium AH-315-B10]|nr:protease complex subunit PrcB family protein [Flavobacteriaceae bacterium AH-315-B10]
MIRLFIAYIFFFSTSCGSGMNKKTNTLLQNTITFEILSQDFFGGITDSKFMIINNEKDLDLVYSSINKSRTPELEMPTIDFDKETVIALFLGEKNSGGYSIAVEQIINVNDKVNVVYRITSPKAGEMVTSVMTQPYCIIKIPKTSKEIVFLQPKF